MSPGRLSPLLAVIPWLCAASSTARADELAELLAAARDADLSLREQGAQIELADAQARVERAARYPSLTVRAGYVRNQREVDVLIPGLDAAVLVPLDQVDGEVRLEVPLLDVQTSSRIEAAEADADAGRARGAAVAVDVDRAVVVAYYQWVAGTALVDAAELAESTAQDTVEVVEGRRDAGAASQLDVARARADVARARQRRADAALVVAGARRELRTRTGRAPEGPAPALPADTAAEAPLDTWLGDADVMPDVRAARAAHRASEVAADAAELSWIPTVTAFAAERLTNASGFGERATWSVGVTATWRLELETLRSARVADAGERVGAVRLGRAAQAARDRITDAWDLIDARRAAADAAAAQVAAAHEALDVARVRIRGGLATPLDLLGAQRDAFAADVELVQARAELAAARALLRLAAGREVTP